MQQPVPKPADLPPPRRWQPPRADVELQRLVQQPRLGQASVAALAPRHKLGLGRAGLEVLVGFLLLGDRGVGAGLLARVAAGGVVMAGVNLCRGGEGEELGDGGVAERGVSRLAALGGGGGGGCTVRGRYRRESRTARSRRPC
jgi:hypothetical protein